MCLDVLACMGRRYGAGARRAGLIGRLCLAMSIRMALASPIASTSHTHLYCVA